MKTISFKQVMVIPALTTLGLGSLLYAQHLSLERPVNAAPLPTSAAVPPAATEPYQLAQAEPYQLAQAEPLQLAQAAPTAQGVEFGGSEAQETNPNQIRATSRNDLLKQARENSGREDPFVSLLNPSATLIVPLPAEPAPLAELETVPVIPSMPARGKGSSGTGLSLPAPNVYYDGGVAYEVPNWNVSGILNTGRDAVAILERDGSIREARLNEVLEDGSKVLKIDSSSVVLQKQGRRYSKTIGGGE
jgi:hypothetical protein